VIEFVPRALRREGKLEPLVALLARHYTHVVDPRHTPAPEPELVPLPDLVELGKRYGRGFTGPLVLRRPR
jgi:hypothetical protein